MKRVFLFLFVCINIQLSHSQEIVKWEFTYNPETGNAEMKATIQEGWHLYSQFVNNDVGPVPTTFTFKTSNDVQLKGAVVEPKPIQKYDENFEATLDFFEGEVVFTQKIETQKQTNVEGSVTFMVCDDTMCLPPVDKTFTIQINPKK
jgi:thiol:disulfide interchange protein DsbD